MMKFKNFSSPQLDVVITNETKFDLNPIIEKVIIEFGNRKNRRTLLGKNIEIIIPLNFASSVYNNSFKADQEYFDKFGYSVANGHFCIPIDSKSDCFKIILNQKIFESEMYLGTIHHELTHVVDFCNYIKHYGNPNYMDEHHKRVNFYYEFFLWTEYNAKRIGMRRLMIEYKKNEYKVAFPQTTALFKKKVLNEKSRLQNLYNLVHFLARISECASNIQKSDDEIFPQRFLKNQYGQNVVSLHKRLAKIKTFEQFLKSRIKLKLLFDY